LHVDFDSAADLRVMHTLARGKLLQTLLWFSALLFLEILGLAELFWLCLISQHYSYFYIPLLTSVVGEKIFVFAKFERG
jgi:hypothetical protein